MIFIIRK